MARTRNPPKFPDYMILQEFIRRNIHYLDDTPTGFSYKKFCTTPKGMFHVKQFEFLKDESRTIAVSCSRRSGKTMGLLARMIDTALNSPDGLCLYICYTATQAYEIIWEPLKRVLNDFGLEFKENNTKKTIKIKRTGCVIQLGGIDKRRELAKYLGKKYNLCVIDECQIFSSSIFKDFLSGVLGPAGWDIGNIPMILAGTPNASCVGPFKDACDGKGQFQSFKHYHWTVHDNPFIRESSGKEVSQILAEWASDHGLVERDPKYRREALGEWVRDDASLVYQLNEEINVYPELPGIPEGMEWSYVLGIDTGYTDADAVCVLAFCAELSPCVYLVEEYQQAKTGWDILYKKVMKLAADYHPISIVVDSAAGGAKFIQDLSIRYNLPVEGAAKAEKQSFIGLFNADLKKGHVLLKEDAKVIEDMNRLEWEWTGQIKRISDKYHGDLIDALFYGWRKCYHYLHEVNEEKDLSKYEKMVQEWKETRKEQVEKEIEDRENGEQFMQFLYGGRA